jgi:hypothetical protein
MASRDTCESIFVSQIHLVFPRSPGSDREEFREADAAGVSVAARASAWRVVSRIVSSPPPSNTERLTTGSARGVERDEVPGDRIKNGHEAALSRSGQRGTRYAGDSIRGPCGCGYATVNAPDPRIPKARRGGTSAPRRLWRRGLIPEPDQQQDRHPDMVNSPLTGAMLSERSW